MKAVLLFILIFGSYGIWARGDASISNINKPMVHYQSLVSKINQLDNMTAQTIREMYDIQSRLVQAIDMIQQENEQLRQRESRCEDLLRRSN